MTSQLECFLCSRDTFLKHDNYSQYCIIVVKGICAIWILPSGVVGNFLLWERSHGIMVTYPIVIRGGT